MATKTEPELKWEPCMECPICHCDLEVAEAGRGAVRLRHIHNKISYLACMKQKRISEYAMEESNETVR